MSKIRLNQPGVGKIKRNTYKIEAIFFSDFGLAEFLHLFLKFIKSSHIFRIYYLYRMCGTIGDDRKNVHFYLKERILDSQKSSLDRPLIVPLLEVDPSSKILEGPGFFHNLLINF